MLIDIISGCSVLKVDRAKRLYTGNNAKQVNFPKSVKNQNISDEGFYIEKAEVILLEKDKKDVFLISIKFSSPDKYLISLKSRSGIEAARILIANDSVFINDRINRKFLIGSVLNLKSKFGINSFLLPVIYGDFIVGTAMDTVKLKCVNGKQELNTVIKGIKISYNVDCKISKVVSVIMEGSTDKDWKTFGYSKFFVSNRGFVPGNISVIDRSSGISILIKIKKFKSPWTGEIEFIPGSKYQKEKLL